MSRRAALQSRLAIFEKTIAENAKHGGGGRSFITTIASTPANKFKLPYRRAPLKVVSEEPATPETVSSTVSFSSTEEEALPTIRCLDEGEEDIVLLRENIDELAESISMIRFELDALEGQQETNTTKATEDELCDVMNHLEASIAINFDMKEEDNEKRKDAEQNDQMKNAQDSKEFDKSLSDLYDGTNMLVDWDVNQSAYRYRAWKERKSKVDTGAKISLKDRMKAFAG